MPNFLKFNKDASGTVIPSASATSETKVFSVSSGDTGSITIPDGHDSVLINIPPATSLMVGWEAPVAPTTTAATTKSIVYTGGIDYLYLNPLHFNGTIYWRALDSSNFVQFLFYSVNSL